MSNDLCGFDMFKNVVKPNDYICHFRKGDYRKIYKHFGKVVSISRQYFFYRDKSNNRLTKGMQYNCVKVDEYSYNVCDNGRL